MKTSIAIIFTLVSFFTFSQFNYDTGSKELDADLGFITVEAERDLGGFKADLVSDYNISLKKLDYMFSIGMKAGEVYLTLEISNIGGKPIDDVLACYKSNKDKGWGYIAKEMGIKPGSPEFHALKGKAKNKKDKAKSSKGSSGKPTKGTSHSKGKKK
ncbi:MAG: hypothetical protein HUJ25_15390 [Crocinitomicaceae bacterium]|nr:hypothetical protein [Crocinitomicaceae bacterium]